DPARAILRGTWFKPRSGGDRSLEAPAQGRRDGTIRSPASYPTGAMERPSSEVWCQPAGAPEESGTNAPFWPGACATRLQHAAPFGSCLQGSGANLHWGRGDEAVGDVLRDE